MICWAESAMQFTELTEPQSEPGRPTSSSYLACWNVSKQCILHLIEPLWWAQICSLKSLLLPWKTLNAYIKSRMCCAEVQFVPGTEYPYLCGTTSSQLTFLDCLQSPLFASCEHFALCMAIRRQFCRLLHLFRAI